MRAHARDQLAAVGGDGAGRQDGGGGVAIGLDRDPRQ
jgi:hypothetical protein